MTTLIQTSQISTRQARRSSRRATSLYSVIVNGEDGNYSEFEVEASSDAEAHAKADLIAQSSMIDITYVEVYRVS